MSYEGDYPEEYETSDEEILAGELGDIIISEKRIIRQSQGSLERRKVGLRFLASCGHLIHHAEEVGGICQQKGCNAIVCRNCLRACARCMKLLCPRHQKLHNGEVYCPRCKLIAMFFGYSHYLKPQASSRERNSILHWLFAHNENRPCSYTWGEDNER